MQPAAPIESRDATSVDLAPHVPPETVRGTVMRREGRLHLHAFAAAPSDSGDGTGEVRRLLDHLRALTGLANLSRYHLKLGFRIEDLVHLQVTLSRDRDQAAVETLLRRLLPLECQLELRPSGSRIELDALFRERDPRRPSYGTRDGRIRVEAFELHVAEHCNLRCRHCCNMSPYLDKHLLTVDEVAKQCRHMAQYLKADVFKIMGGEPLLHPQITEILFALRETGISDVIRLFTNGLLLSKMTDAFWQALDQLTVSNYESAPVRPEHLALFRAQAERFDVVLNIKPVDRFSQVLSSERRDDPKAIQTTYDDCWLRHRCLVVRDGHFFKCTRAAYFQDFQERLDIAAPEPEPLAVMRGDGIPVGAPDLQRRLLDYLNSPHPLGACRYCLGSSGPVVPHSQLTRIDVKRGRL